LAHYRKIGSTIPVTKSAMQYSIRTGQITMDATWCFILGMMAGFVPSFVLLILIFLGAV
jgi:hypothetical protein